MEKSIGKEEQVILQNLLRQYREEAGLTQRALASRLHTGHSRISDYETGQRRLDLVQFMEYCQGLGISPVEFVKRFTSAVAVHQHETETDVIGDK